MITVEQSDTPCADFTGIARKINEQQTRWRPRPDQETISILDRSTNPYWKQADRALFLARKDGRVLGRIAATVDTEVMRQHSSREGFFGFFECENDSSTSAALLDAAAHWLADRGCDTMHGPFAPLPDFDNFGLLVEGFDAPQVAGEPFNPEYYPRLFEECGLAKESDFFAFQHQLADNPVFDKTMSRLEKIFARHHEATVRDFDIVHFDRDEEIARKILTESFEDQPLYSMLNKETQSYLLKTLAAPEDMHWFMFVEIGGTPVGINLLAPNYDDLLYGDKVRSIRSNEFCILPAYHHTQAAATLTYRGWEKVRNAGLEFVFLSHEAEFHKEMHHILESFGSRRTKRFRVYSKNLAAS